MVEGGDAAGQFTQRHRGWLLAEGRLARELSERSEVDTGRCWATKTIQKQPHWQILAHFFCPRTIEGVLQLQAPVFPKK